MTKEITVRSQGWLEGLREKVMDVVDRWTGRKDSSHQVATASNPRSFHAVMAGPAVDLVDEGESLHLLAELPGLAPADLHVKVDGRSIFLSGEKSMSSSREEGNVRISESRWGAFSRVIPLPAEVKVDEVEAVLRHGVLDMHLPKVEAARPHRVEVEVD